MRDVQVQHVVALMEFMYAGEVNVAQADLSAFLRTAESLRIRGLTDTTSPSPDPLPKEDLDLDLNPHPSTSKNAEFKPRKSSHNISSSSTVTSSQDVSREKEESPPPKRHCKTEKADQPRMRNQEFVPKIEMPEYLSDEEAVQRFFPATTDVTELPGGMEIIPQTVKEVHDGTMQGECGLEGIARDLVVAVVLLVFVFLL